MIKRCCEYDNVANFWSVNNFASVRLFFPLFNASMSPFKEAIVRYEYFLLLTRRQIWKISLFNPRTYAQIHTPTVVQGGGGGGRGWNPPRSFWYVAVFWNDFTFGWKPLILLTRWGMFYGWWRFWRTVTSPTMVVILVLPRIRNQVTTARNGNFFVLDMKNNT